MKKIDLRHIKWNNLTTTSPGMVPKYIDKDKFYKLSSYNLFAGFYGEEPVYEELAYQIGIEIGVNMVPIETKIAFVRYENIEYATYVSISPNFSSKNQYFPIERFCIVNNLKTYDILYGKYEEDISKLLIFDFLINNKDRHGRNIEINEEELAPIFDNSFSFCSKIDEKQLNDKLFEDYTANNYLGYPNLFENLNLILKSPKLNLNTENINKIVEIWAEKFKISNKRREFIKNLLEFRIKIIKDKFYNKKLMEWI